MRNTFGNLFTLTTFGESHGAAVGGVIDGMPAGIDIDLDFIQQELDRRRPGQSSITTSRQEADKVELLSGVFEGKSTGCPIGFIVRNTNQHSQDYENLRCLFRPSHADFTYKEKYGVRDHRGGGRSSARITISRCVGGALAKLALRQLGISVKAYTSQVGHIALEHDYRHYDLTLTEQNAVRCPDPEKAAQMEALIKEVKAEGDTIGGIITGVVTGCPAGLGEPEFDKLHAALGQAMLSINAVKGRALQASRPEAAARTTCSAARRGASRQPPTTVEAFRAASPTDRTSTSAWPSNRWLRFSQNRRRSIWRETPRLSQLAGVTTPVYYQEPYLSLKQWLQ